MSRQYNITLRMLRSYEKYMDDFSKRASAWRKKGYTPVAPRPLSYDEFVANRTYLKSRGVAPGNVTRVIISQQLYEFSEQQAKDLYTILKGDGVTELEGVKVTIQNIKGGLGKQALSYINEQLKQQGMISGYERAQWITEHIYEDSL